MTKPKCSLFVNDQENIMADILAEAALVDSTQLSQGVDEILRIHRNYSVYVSSSGNKPSDERPWLSNYANRLVCCAVCPAVFWLGFVGFASDFFEHTCNRS